MAPDEIRKAAEQIAGCFAGHAELNRWQEAIRALAAPCVIQRAVEEPAPEQGCRFGGDPIVPDGSSWPDSPHRPMTFIGQLNFAELAAVHDGLLPGFPDDGILAFFCDIEEIEAGGYKPAHRRLWQIAYTPPDTPAVRLPAPPFTRTPSYDQAPPCRAIASRLSLSLPDVSANELDYLRAVPEAEEVLDRYYHLYQEYYYDLFRERDRQEHQVGGHPHWVQHDERLTAQLASHGIACGSPEASKTPEALALRPGRADWRLLWQIGSDAVSGFYWCLDGTLYILIRTQDLEARAFDKCWVLVQGT
jgi:uncharacterized protein YwqG